MKKSFAFMIVVFLVFFGFLAMAGDPFDELMASFDKEYNAIKPPSRYSSVNTDYKLEQTALGTMYITKAIGLLYRQNQEFLAKYDDLLRKYDKVIEQNREMIRLLSVLTKNQVRGEKGKADKGRWIQQ
ncbi:MAG: hypothetical protein DRH12_10655 [Deltaproteobacteria bacterium]|nr:MAG: hypothetical protein DRH12_10655 [Deltaproteobacteria bacterium]